MIEVFAHDRIFQFIPWRVALVIRVVVKLFLVRSYLPFVIAGALGLIGMFIEITS